MPEPTDTPPPFEEATAADLVDQPDHVADQTPEYDDTDDDTELDDDVPPVEP